MACSSAAGFFQQHLLSLVVSTCNLTPSTVATMHYPITMEGNTGSCSVLLHVYVSLWHKTFNRIYNASACNVWIVYIECLRTFRTEHYLFNRCVHARNFIRVQKVQYRQQHLRTGMHTKCHFPYSYSVSLWGNIHCYKNCSKLSSFSWTLIVSCIEAIASYALL